MEVRFHNYIPEQDKWEVITEQHASLQAAAIRAKVRGWSLEEVDNRPSNKVILEKVHEKV